LGVGRGNDDNVGKENEVHGNEGQKKKKDTKRNKEPLNMSFTEKHTPFRPLPPPQPMLEEHIVDEHIVKEQKPIPSWKVKYLKKEIRKGNIPKVALPWQQRGHQGSRGLRGGNNLGLLHVKYHTSVHL